MKFKISEQLPQQQQVAQQPQAQPQVQQALPVYDPNTGLTIPIASLQDPKFVQKLNIFFKQNGIRFAIPIPKKQVQQPQVQQPMR